MSKKEKLLISHKVFMEDSEEIKVLSALKMEITVLREEILYEAKKLWRESILFTQTSSETQLKVTRMHEFDSGLRLFTYQADLFLNYLCRQKHFNRPLQITVGAETQTMLVDALDALALYNQLHAHLKQFADRILNLLLKPLILGGKKGEKQHPSLVIVENVGDGKTNSAVMPLILLRSLF